MISCMFLYHEEDLTLTKLSNVELTTLSSLDKIFRFIKLVQAQDMALILRVGPYICAEWNFGGLPPWLLGRPYLAQVLVPWRKICLTLSMEPDNLMTKK